MCVFCRHYNRDELDDGPDCAAFHEIPDAIYAGDFDHREPFPGDGGIRFDLDPTFGDDFTEVMEIRQAVAERASLSH